MYNVVLQRGGIKGKKRTYKRKCKDIKINICGEPMRDERKSNITKMGM